MAVSFKQIRDWMEKVVVEPKPEPALMYAIAKAESSMSPIARNRKTRAKGLYQLTPICLKDLRERWGLLVDPFDPIQATEGAAVYISWLMRRFPEDIRLVLAAWNWGIGNVQKWLRNEKEMPKETKNFIEKVLKEYERMRDANET